MLHHQDAVHYLTGTGHPALVTGHRLRTADKRALPLEQTPQRHGLVHVALMGRRGMGVDIVDIAHPHSGILHGTAHGHHAAVVAGLRDSAAVRREAIASHLAENLCTTGHGMVVVFQHQRRSAATRNQSVAVAVEGPAGLRRFVHPYGEGRQGVERGHRIVIRLLGTAAEHHVLQSLTNHHHAQTYAVAAAGTGRAHREVDATQMENGVQVHGHRRVHRLEDIARTQHGRVVFLVHNLLTLHHGLRRRVVTEDDAHLVVQQVVIVNASLLKCLSGSHIGIFALLGQSHTDTAVEQSLQFGFLHNAGQSRAVSVFQSFRLQSNSRLSLIE